MNLRDYQQEASDGVVREWQQVKSTMVVVPTGGGKTVIFSDIIKRCQPARAIVIAHRQELIFQAKQTIERMTGLPVEIEMGEMVARPDLFHNCPVVVSTVQTQNSNAGLRKRMGRFDPADFGMLIIDECHHGAADSYRNLINYYTKNPDLRVVGFTATPDRHDEEALGQVFESVAYNYEILDAIHDGWLVPVEQQLVHVHDLDFSEIHTTAGDLNGAELAELMESERNMQGVTSSALEIIGSRRSIVFTVSVKQAEMGCEIFNRRKPGMAEWVCGKTPDDKREDILRRFLSGQVQVVFNCDVLTEGYDNPAVEVIVMARPTKSRSKYAQMAGRSLRPLPGLVDGLVSRDERKAAIAASPKPACLVLDFVGNSGRHKLMTTADLLGGNVSDDILEKAIARAKKLGKPVRMAELIDEEEAKAEQERLEAERRRKLAAARREQLVGRAQFSTRMVNPFDALDIQPVRERGWDSNHTISEKQRALLLKQGVDPQNLPYAQAKQVLNEMFRRWGHNLCSLKQAALIKKLYKGEMETRNLTREDASRLISQKIGDRKKPEASPEPQTEQAPPVVEEEYRWDQLLDRRPQ